MVYYGQHSVVTCYFDQSKYCVGSACLENGCVLRNQTRHRDVYGPLSNYTLPTLPQQNFIFPASLMGCICPGDATPLCKNEECPRRPREKDVRGL